MKFAFIAKYRAVWPVAWMCVALGQQTGEGLLRRRRQSAPGRRRQHRRFLRQAEVELRIRPARSARRLWHGDLPRARAMLVH